MGPIIHIHDVLAHRAKPEVVRDRAAFRRRLDPTHAERIKPTGLSREISALARSAYLTEAQLRRSRSALRRFWLREVQRTSRMRLADVVHRALPR
jgi:hypothetical protein